MDALIFDFDGVIVDSEPIHLRGFRKVLALIGIELTSQEYYRKYLGYDDQDCFKAVLADKGMEQTAEQIKAMIEAKSQAVQEELARSVQPLDGAVEMIAAAAESGILVGVCSGALKKEIVLSARKIGILEHLEQIVSAEDVRKGKPDPEGYRLALSRLSASAGRDLPAAKCVAIEDSPAGIAAAKAAGMKVLAVTNSYDAEALTDADKVVDSLTSVGLDCLDELTRT